MRPSSKIIMTAILCAFVVVGAIAPFTLMLLPNPVPVRVGAPARQLPGTYVLTSGSVYHVFQFTDNAETFPVHSLVAATDATVYVRYKGLDDLAVYGLFRYPSGSQVAASKSVNRPARVLELRPEKPLAPGRYAVRVSSEDPFGGPEYAYFSVSATQPPSASTAR